MPQFRHRPLEVEAFRIIAVKDRAFGAAVDLTLDGGRKVRSCRTLTCSTYEPVEGDYWVAFEDGTEAIYSQRDFKKRFEPIPEPTTGHQPAPEISSELWSKKP